MTPKMPLLRQAGLNPDLLHSPGSRYPRSGIMQLWTLAAEVTGDPLIGLHIGSTIRSTSYHALGFAWLSSRTLLDALKRLARYYRVIATVPLEISVAEFDDAISVTVAYTDAEYPSPPIALDSFLASIVSLCRMASRPDFRPQRLELDHDSYGQADEYEKVFGCPVAFNTGRNVFWFNKEQMLELLPGHNVDAVLGNDRIVERYLETLDPDQVTTEVRRMLVNLFPAGEASQQIVAQRMARSISTLQRQLHSEGTSYRELQDDVREQLAAEYVREGKYSLSQIAYLLGFSDQSNFSRAFKRWKGMSPKEYQVTGRAN